MTRLADVVRRIRQSGLTIYDSLDGTRDLFLDDGELESLLQDSLRGLNLNYPLRTRSKVLKSAACEALGYPAPASFQKTNPRFPGQDFDTYIQKSNNLQIWNEELSPSRRYALIRLDEASVVVGVKVVNGKTLALLDRTGTLTQKFQAKSRSPVITSVLGSTKDTAPLRRRYGLDGRPTAPASLSCSPTEAPSQETLLPIEEVFQRLARLVGERLVDPGADQERNRGAALHRRVCAALGYTVYRDRGQFPDVPNQALEVKLQTAATIDLGLVTPDSTAPLAGLPGLKHRDVRYAIFYGATDGQGVRLDHLVLTTGKDFFRLFRRFEGRVLSRKLQIPLPAGFFDQPE